MNIFKKFLISTLIFLICALCSHASDLFDYVKNCDVSALKASVNSKNADLKNSNDDSLLHVAVKEKKYEALSYLAFSKKCNLNLRDKYGRTPVFIAAQNGDLNALSLLINAGADINKRSYNGKTPLLSAVENNHADCAFKCVKSGANVKLKDYDGNDVLLTAVRGKNAGTVKAILPLVENINIRDASGSTPLMIASATDKTVTELLVKNGAEINAVNKFGLTALHISILNNRPDCAIYLTEAGANPNIVSFRGLTALNIARAKKLPEVEKVLIENGAKDF